MVTFPTGLPAPNNLITYVCTIAIAGNNNVHTRPSGTLTPTRNWTPIGSHNPCTPAGTITISNGAAITINSTSPLVHVIVLGSLTVSVNGAVVIATPMTVAGTLTASNCGSFNCTSIFHANSIAIHNTGTSTFTTTLTASIIGHTATSLASYRGLPQLLPTTQQGWLSQPGILALYLTATPL